MHKYAFLFFGWCLHALAFGQDSTSVGTDSLGYRWEKVRSYALDSSEVWQVDVLGNVYLTNGSQIVKYDSAGVLKFRQSIKSYGKASQIAPVNTMKLIYFSEEQQTICFLDNTLSEAEDRVDLSDYEVYNATHIATSSRPDLLWVYDEVNSTLKLISLANVGEVTLEIMNVKGILGTNHIHQIAENSNYLYLLDKDNGLYVLDFYGGLIDHYATQGVLKVQFDSNSTSAVELEPEELVVRRLDPGVDASARFALPEDAVGSFQMSGGFVYLRTSTHVHKYTLHLRQ